MRSPMRSMDSYAMRFDFRPVKALSFAIALLLVGCASSGDVEQTRQERQQAKAKMSAELQQERALAASMERESEAKKASAEKLAQALGGKQGKVEGKAPAKTLGAGDGSGTTLTITNGTASAVPVMITLGAGYGISNISQLPSSWGVIQDPVGIQGLSGVFILAGNNSVSFNSGTSSFSGNVAFGPTSFGRGCGSSGSQPNPCYPNATNLAEFTLNYSKGEETVDISDVNGVNAKITVNFTPQGSTNWNDGPTGQAWANQNVTQIAANQPITKWTSPPGVYGWQGTNCTTSVNPPNPSGSCLAPVNAPTSSQLQTNAQCNIQRAVGASGGTVEVVFGGFTDLNSKPQSGCMAVYTISPASGSLSGYKPVTMTGWGLSQVTSVTFQGAAATITSQTDTTLVVTTPPCNFCNGNPGYSNVMLNWSNVSYIVPNNAAGWDASGAYYYTSP